MLNKVLQSSGVKKLESHTVFTYNKVTRKFSYDVSDLWISIFLQGSLIQLLGIEKQQASSDQTVIIGKSKQNPTYKFPGDDVERTLAHPNWQWTAASNEKDKMSHVCQLVMVQTLCVYCNIIESQKTGDSYSDLLRLVSIKGDKVGQQIVEHYDKPFFLKVNSRFVPSITIWIYDIYGKPIDFKIGEVRLKLQFITKPE